MPTAKPANLHSIAYARQLLIALTKIKGLKNLKLEKPTEYTPATGLFKDFRNKQAQKAIEQETTDTIVSKKIKVLRDIHDGLVKANQKANTNSEVLSEQELAEIMSYAMQQEFSKEELASIVKAANLGRFERLDNRLSGVPADSHLHFKYVAETIKLEDGISEAMADISKKIEERELEKRLAKQPKEIQAIRKDLTINIDAYTQQIAHVEMSDYKKTLLEYDLNIFKYILKKLETDTTAANLLKQVTLIGAAAPVHRADYIIYTGIGATIKHYQKEIIASVPNGNHIMDLHKYIEKRKKEVELKGSQYYAKSSFASDLPSKIHLAVTLLDKYQKGETLSLDEVKAARAENKKLTEKGFALLHRAGKLDSILGKIENELMAKSAKKAVQAVAEKAGNKEPTKTVKQPEPTKQAPVTDGSDKNKKIDNKTGNSKKNKR